MNPPPDPESNGNSNNAGSTPQPDPLEAEAIAAVSERIYDRMLQTGHHVSHTLRSVSERVGHFLKENHALQQAEHLGGFLLSAYTISGMAQSLGGAISHLEMVHGKIIAGVINPLLGMAGPAAHITAGLAALGGGPANAGPGGPGGGGGMRAGLGKISSDSVLAGGLAGGFLASGFTSTLSAARHSLGDFLIRLGPAEQSPRIRVHHIADQAFIDGVPKTIPQPRPRNPFLLTGGDPVPEIPAPAPAPAPASAPRTEIPKSSTTFFHNVFPSHRMTPGAPSMNTDDRFTYHKGQKYYNSGAGYPKGGGFTLDESRSRGFTLDASGLPLPGKKRRMVRKNRKRYVQFHF